MSEKNIELRSESVQEILGRPPRWIIRWGISIIFVIVAGLVVGSYFFKYPDVLTATITVTTENLPAGVMAKTTGRIDTLFVSEKQIVQQGDILAVIENAACFGDVMALRDVLERDERDNRDNRDDRDSLDAVFPCHASRLSRLSRVTNLGEIQPTYQQFLKAYEDYQYFIATDFHHKKIKVIQKQIQTQNLILSKSKNQLNLNSQQLATAQQTFTMDSILYAKNALSGAEYQNAKNSYLQQLQSYESAKLGIDNQNISILQSEQTIFDLEQQRNEQLNNLQIALTGALNQLQTQIKTWEQTYLLFSPIDGVVTFTK
jgi:HlyD family secretion protein